MAGTAFDLLLWYIAAALIVESSADPDNATALVRTAVRFALRLLLPALVILVLTAPVVLRVIGPAYEQHGTRLLQSLALALPFMGVNVLYVTFARMARRVRRIVVVQVSARFSPLCSPTYCSSQRVSSGQASRFWEARP